MWVLTLSGEHVQVLRAALILVIRLHDLEIDFVCEMVTIQHILWSRTCSGSACLDFSPLPV